MPTTRRTHVCRITNHAQVAGALGRHGWSASKLWNVANYYARQQWDEPGEIPDENELKHELKTQHQIQRTALAVQPESSIMFS